MGDIPDEPASVRAIRDPTAPPGAWVRWRGANPLRRGSKFTLPTQERVIGVLARTGSMNVAAKVAGVARRTLDKWFDRGRAELETVAKALEDGVAPEDLQPAPFAEFLLECQRAAGFAQAELVDLVAQSAFAGDWRAAAWLLERMGDKIAAEHVTVDVTPGEIAEQIRSRFALIRERAQALHEPEP